MVWTIRYSIVHLSEQYNVHRDGGQKDENPRKSTGIRYRVNCGFSKVQKLKKISPRSLNICIRSFRNRQRKLGIFRSAKTNAFVH